MTEHTSVYNVINPYKKHVEQRHTITHAFIPHTFIHTYIHTYIHTNIHAYIHTDIHA